MQSTSYVVFNYLTVWHNLLSKTCMSDNHSFWVENMLDLYQFQFIRNDLILYCSFKFKGSFFLKHIIVIIIHKKKNESLTSNLSLNG